MTLYIYKYALEKIQGENKVCISHFFLRESRSW